MAPGDASCSGDFYRCWCRRYRQSHQPMTSN
jgi:hypothetical protein